MSLQLSLKMIKCGYFSAESDFFWGGGGVKGRYIFFCQNRIKGIYCLFTSIIYSLFNKCFNLFVVHSVLSLSSGQSSERQENKY